ncbi:MAG: hypothetical protein JNK10_14580, partial [Cyclobacteriaceae bacterium]|nr:hypothetical protein [Cyclobacteriaceae bacterium]
MKNTHEYNHMKKLALLCLFLVAAVITATTDTSTSLRDGMVNGTPDIKSISAL